MIDVPPIISHSEFSITPHRHCPNLKRGQWFVIDESITGDAPKDFLAVYEFGATGCRRAKRNSWPRYIAKVGHKWYPNESVTEHLITRMGQRMGLDIADSRLAHIQGQLRFMSRYFLGDTQYLLHGADIFAAYLEDHDREFVQGVEDENKSPEYFDYDFAVDSIRTILPSHADSILRGFHRMLAFDALIGNNDRHFFNWGVICDHAGKQPPRFSPIFDTARALFWNRSESSLAEMARERGGIAARIQAYCSKSCPKIGVSSKGRVNHFDLLHSMLSGKLALRADLDLLAGLDLEPVALARDLFRGEFRKLVSPLRQTWICRLIEHRTELFRRVLSGEQDDA